VVVVVVVVLIGNVSDRIIYIESEIMCNWQCTMSFDKQGIGREVVFLFVL
jgi:hypothetical protein